MVAQIWCQCPTALPLTTPSAALRNPAQCSCARPGKKAGSCVCILGPDGCARAATSLAGMPLAVNHIENTQAASAVHRPSTEGSAANVTGQRLHVCSIHTPTSSTQLVTLLVSEQRAVTAVHRVSVNLSQLRSSQLSQVFGGCSLLLSLTRCNAANHDIGCGAPTTATLTFTCMEVAAMMQRSCATPSPHLRPEVWMSVHGIDVTHHSEALGHSHPPNVNVL